MKLTNPANNTTAKQSYVTDAIFPISSLLLMALGFMFCRIFSLSGGTLLLLGALFMAATAYFILSMFNRTEMDKFFEDAGISFNGRFPQVVSRRKLDDDSYEYQIKQPPGMSLDKWKELQQGIEESLRAAVTFTYDYKSGYIIMNTTRKRLKQFYKYEQPEGLNPLEVCVGYSIDGPIMLDIEKAVHVLIGGEPGGGKSTLLRGIETSLINKPDDTEIYNIDFQRVELGIFRRSRKVSRFISDPEELSNLLSELRAESDRRLKLFDDLGVVNIRNYNARAQKKLGYKVIVIDEFAALADKQYSHIMDALRLRLAQDRKTGIHFIISTQRPDASVVNGSLKGLIEGRIAFKVADSTNSRIILDAMGAEALRGSGHGILKLGGEQREFQAFFLTEDEAEALVHHTFADKLAAPAPVKRRAGAVKNDNRKG